MKGRVDYKSHEKRRSEQQHQPRRKYVDYDNPDPEDEVKYYRRTPSPKKQKRRSRSKSREERGQRRSDRDTRDNRDNRDNRDTGMI